jgi:hypothetical protein
MLPNYDVNQDGVIYQLSREPFTYDTEYVDARYNTYGDLNAWMSHLRLGYIVGAIGRIPESIIDVGYGNGAFLETCTRIIPNCYGFDVSGYPVPPGVTFAEDWMSKPVDVVTFFDVLEHFEDPYVIRDLKAKYVVISLPWCHYRSDDWFDTWKHRRPNEHLWFFNPQSMMQFAESTGYELLHFSNLEDTIRRSPDGSPNILSVTLKRVWN